MAVSIRSCLGIDIGTHSIRVAQLEMGKAGPRVSALAEDRLQIEAGLTEDKRQQQIAKQLQALIKTARINTRNAVFCVPGQSVFVRRIKLPKSTPERMRGMIRFAARQQIPFPLDQTIMEYQIFETPGSPECDVLLVAVKRDYILNFMKLVRRTGLRAIGISVSSLALYNFHELNNSTRPLTTVKPPKPKAAPKKGKKGEPEPEPEPEEPEMLDEASFEEIQAFVNLGASMMDLAIPRPGAGHMIGFTRSVPLAGNEMHRAIRDKLGLDSPEAARKILEEESAVLASDLEISGDADSYNAEASEAVTGIVDRLVSELRRSLDFYISQPDGVAVDRLVLSGGLSQLNYLGPYIEEKMGLPVEMTTIRNEQLRLTDSFSGNFAPFTIAAGLGLQGLGLAQNKIDFLPEEVKSVRGLRERAYEVAGMVAMLIVIIAMSLNVGSSYVSSYNNQSTSYEQRLNEVKNDDIALTEAETLDKQVKEAYDKLARSVGFRDYWLRFMREILAQRPPEVLIDSLGLRLDGLVVMTGVARSQSAINQFVEGVKMIKSDEPGEPTVLEAKIVKMQQRQDARFGTQMAAFEVQIKTLIRGPRLRTIGERPYTKEQINTLLQNENLMRNQNNMGGGMFRPGRR